MVEVNEKLEIREIQKALRGIKIEIHKTNELLKLLWEFMHENPVIAITLATHDTGSENEGSGYLITFKNYGNRKKCINHFL